MFRKQISPHEGCTIIIFGASGDLSKRKLFPSLFQLYNEDMLPKVFHIVGYARTRMNTEEFKEKLQEFSSYDEEFLSHITYISGQYDSVEHMKCLDTIFNQHSRNRIYYLSLPPSEFRNVCKTLKQADLITQNSGGMEHAHTIIGEQPYSRIALEKPFGTSLESAIKLERFLSQHFDPSQIFTIDHYLGKEPVQNILFFRFANTIFESIWNNQYIESIEVSMLEDIKVEKRAGYFDSTGILQDMIQSHGLQILALAMMEPPQSFNAKDVRIEKSKVLSALTIYDYDVAALNELVVRGQYEGYLLEEGVEKNSETETFVAMKTYINNWRWAGVPIYIRTGKALKEKRTELVINFKKIPYNLFDDVENSLTHNRLIFRFQPETFINLRIMSKIPGNQLQIKPTELDFPYDIEFKEFNYANGYDRILFSIFDNNATLFLSSDELFAQWKFIDSIITLWKNNNNNNNIPIFSYPCGSDGPKEVSKLFDSGVEAWNT